jgi:hypothetical protein
VLRNTEGLDFLDEAEYVADTGINVAWKELAST